MQTLYKPTLVLSSALMVMQESRCQRLTQKFSMLLANVNHSTLDNTFLLAMTKNVYRCQYTCMASVQVDCDGTSEGKQ